jgi:hypothetical protein
MRLREAAVPVIVLALSLRRWRPLPVCLAVLGLAVAWSLTAHVKDFLRNASDPTASAAYWTPAIRYLDSHLGPSYRVEVVDTTGHWAAVYLPRQGIPLVRGWFRQDDFPENRLLYQDFTRVTYLRWLRSLGVRYVVLTSAPPDWSARDEAALVASGRSGLRRTFRSSTVSIFSVPHPTGILTGPGHPSVLSLTRATLHLDLPEPGRYRLAVRYSPYWSAPRAACLEEGKDGMIRLVTSRGGPLPLRFKVNGRRALAALEGHDPQGCSK